MSDSIDTVYGRMNKIALLQARDTFDMLKLFRCVEEFSQVSEYLSSESGPRDSLARLHCMAATVLCGASASVPPEDGDLSILLSDLRSDLDEAVAFFQSCIAVIEPLERLPDPRR